MEDITEKTIVKLEIRTNWADLLIKFAKEHPFLNVTLHTQPVPEEDVDLVKMEFRTHKCGKAEANKRFFYFLLMYAEWRRLKSI